MKPDMANLPWAQKPDQRSTGQQLRGRLHARSSTAPKLKVGGLRTVSLHFCLCIQAKRGII